MYRYSIIGSRRNTQKLHFFYFIYVASLLRNQYCCLQSEHMYSSNIFLLVFYPGLSHHPSNIYHGTTLDNNWGCGCVENFNASYLPLLRTISQPHLVFGDKLQPTRNHMKAWHYLVSLKDYYDHVALKIGMLLSQVGGARLKNYRRQVALSARQSAAAGPLLAGGFCRMQGHWFAPCEGSTADLIRRA
jgi:hypothetical protein